jgi:hypothetical protein
MRLKIQKWRNPEAAESRWTQIWLMKKSLFLSVLATKILNPK